MLVLVMIRALIVAVVAFTALVLRYSVLSGLTYWYFWKRHPADFAAQRIQNRQADPARIRDEVRWSLTSFAILALGAALVSPLAFAGHTKLYFSFAEHGIAYFLASIAILILAHDAYFYFAHRLMHTKWLFKHVHRVHHLSTDPSPLAAFSFHPAEAAIEGAFVFGMIFILPVHFLAVILFLFFSHAMNAIGHLGYELYPADRATRFPWSLLNSATGHNEHHARFRGNYGLYFTFWDKWLGTEISSAPAPPRSACYSGIYATR